MSDFNDNDKKPSSTIQYNVSPTTAHAHTGVDSPRINARDIIGLISNGRSHGAAVTSITDSVDTKVQLNANDFANGITWDATNHRFTIGVSGQYQATGLVTYTGTVASKSYRSALSVNGGGASGAYSANASAQSSLNSILGITCSDILNLNAGDYVELYTFQVSGGAATILTGTSLTYLSLTKV